ncbi:LacI family DNA-binding transcriptional regulator [Subtercola endophyticus]|uniref:LacI family DNA-binding transcriptional regulator n=1 Tax=Subtercola endophyticus TaxID=2895559 RepID=UPI001E29B65F|nr:substrate-binding domain-containing protein [Subtercola endophyticus]UFS60669.1 substrate-binding domain-containing protein [Subtercola endophyticus]
MALPKSHGQRAPTIYDVARVAGVSHQSVSRFLNGETLRENTRTQVEAAITELGYRLNPAARALATNVSYRIGALVYELQELGPSQIAQGAADQARSAGFLLDIVALDPRDDAAIAHAIDLLDQQHLAGILALAPTQRLLDALQAVEYRIPVYIDSEPVFDGTAETETLNSVGTVLALEHLRGLGHRRIFHISGPLDWISAANRSTAYRAYMLEHDMPFFEPFAGDWTSASGYAAVRSIPFDAGITAIFVANDQMAMGVLLALSERGLRVPEDISVVSFDDVPESEFTIPPLTTVRLNFAEQGRVAVERLVAMIKNEPEPALPEQPRVSLTVRRSTAPRPSASRN